MTEAKHTPGPWELGGCSGRMVKPVAFYGGDGFIADVDTEANARLIAAAPDLLESLESLVPILTAVRFSVGLGKNQLERIERAKAAIAKAKGGTP